MKRELTPKLLRVGILLGSLLFSLPAISGYYSIQTSADAQSATSATLPETLCRKGVNYDVEN
jgi:hypothetical protein